jgi:hypothetical protein
MIDARQSPTTQHPGGAIRGQVVKQAGSTRAGRMAAAPASEFSSPQKRARHRPSPARDPDTGRDHVRQRAARGSLAEELVTKDDWRL